MLGFAKKPSCRVKSCQSYEPRPELQLAALERQHVIYKVRPIYALRMLQMRVTNVVAILP
eukprot:SAG31_NODE_2416_length_5732_cov_1.503462_2_plen_60_part_00